MCSKSAFTRGHTNGRILTLRPKTSSQELKQRWIKYGDLATGLVYSDVAPFTLPEHFKNPRCPLKP